MTQPTLFDVKKVDLKCPACGERDPKHCRHNHDKRHDEIQWNTPRPRGCLASSQLRPEDPLPI